MRVWIVFNENDVEAPRKWWVDSVWRTRKQAKKRCEQLRAANVSAWASPWIEEHSVSP